MKVAEAELKHLDTIPSIARELDTYRKQLARNYLTDDEINDKLLHEAYDRMKEDVHVEHILILCAPGADTAVAYRTIDSIYHVAISKKGNFEELADAFTQDKGTKGKGGDVGYITVFETVYPFECAVYGTPVGKISAPFRTQFGYHIVKVLDKRAARGQVQVAQILVATPKSKGEEGIAAGRKRIDSVKMLLNRGVSFDSLVKRYSDDRYTKNEGGVMKSFSVGQMVAPFENAAFALKKPGDVSEPIQTEYGFHIIKLIEKTPVKPYDSVQSVIKKKVENDSRAQMARDIYMNKIKEQNGFKEYPANLNAMIDRMKGMVPDTGKKAGIFKADDFMGMNKPVFALSGKEYTQTDFAKYMESITRGHITGKKEQVVRDLYKMYLNSVVNDFEEHKLAETNPDFKNLMEEYKDGIMLFELMDKNVWSKASKDTTGLEAFYAQHKDKYMWEPGFKGGVYKFKDEATAKEGMKVLEKKKATDEDLMKAVNKNNNDAVSVQHGHYEFSRFKDVPQAELQSGKVTQPVKTADGMYTVVKVDEVYSQPTQKSLDEARGYVVAEYQDYLEKQWNDQMRKKYPVKVNEQVFQSMVKK
jgi:peptidyl-prolyl cis-trans isomerase SurA